ncbi:MAG TPA: DUF5317 domain-containing protein [Armatimonadota bacterium]|nr:DUF5317 domain-containing protein [Armatimonadota bacterium]
MLFLEIGVLSVLVALIRRGQIFRLADLEIRRIWLVTVPVAVILASIIFRRTTPPEIWQPVTGALHLVTSAALFALFWSNRKLPGIKWLLAGWLLNFAPILTNGGRMPVSKWAVKIAYGSGQEGRMLQHIWMSSQTKFNFLGDFIPLPTPLVAIPEVVSPGDILMAVGLFLLIQLTMCPRKKKASESKG